jgi:outer membrane immunogenic protein
MNKRIGLVFTSVVMLGLAGLGVASAADMPLKARAPAPVATTFSGCYIDVGGGYGMWNQNQHTETYPGLVPTTVADTVDGGKGYLGRFGGGCDYQFTGTLSNWVVGVLGDYDVMGLKGTDNFQNVGVGGVFGAPSYAPEKERNAWYIGGRVGYLVTSALLSYVSAGYTQTSFGQQNFTFLNTGLAANSFLPGATYQGWFLGGGTEYALNFPALRGLFWRNEYRYASYNSKDLQLLGPGATPGYAQHTTPYVQTITTSLVWKFNWAQPVVAKY